VLDLQRRPPTPHRRAAPDPSAPLCLSCDQPVGEFAVATLGAGFHLDKVSESGGGEALTPVVHIPEPHSNIRTLTLTLSRALPSEAIVCETFDPLVTPFEG
jgi:hypothetical protein